MTNFRTLYRQPLNISHGVVRVTTDRSNKHSLFVDNTLYHVLNVGTFSYSDLYSSFLVAEGHCVLSGLGLGVLANWVLEKPDVTKVTVIEKSSDVISLNRKLGLLENPKMEVICSDINLLENISCDVLLLDHYELVTQTFIEQEVKNISERHNHSKLWFFRAEISAYNYFIKVHNQITFHTCSEWLQSLNSILNISNLYTGFTDKEFKNCINAFYLREIFQSGVSLENRFNLDLNFENY